MTAWNAGLLSVVCAFSVVALLPSAEVMAFMDCNVRLCGVLTLSTGFGNGHYSHTHPVVHGLWPETGTFGDSSCLHPEDPSDLPFIPSSPDLLQCYNDGDSEMTEEENWFVNHEWNKHGKCAGMPDVETFLDTVCGLAKVPLKVMDKARKKHGDQHTAKQLAKALEKAGFPVYDFIEGFTREVQLSACAGDDLVWKLAPFSNFEEACPSSPLPPAPPAPPTPEPESTCQPGFHGPPCPGGDTDCDGVEGCLRCASNGFCTNVPLPSEGSCLPGFLGPSCDGDDDCEGKPGCLRCAHSGYCTDQPLPGQHRACLLGHRGPPCPGGDSDCADLGGCVRCAKSGYCTGQHYLPGGGCRGPRCWMGDILPAEEKSPGRQEA